MALCNTGEFTAAKVGNFFCNFVLFNYARNTLLFVSRIPQFCKVLFSRGGGEFSDHCRRVANAVLLS